MNQTQPHHKQQAYPQHAAPEKKLTRQTCGFIIACIALVVLSNASAQSLYEAFSMLLRSDDVTFDGLELTALIFKAAGCFVCVAFYALMLFKPEFLAGKPDKKKLLYLVAANGFIWIWESIKNPTVEAVLGLFALHSFSVAINFLMYYGDDESKSCFNCFKPWVYKKVP
jgi:hypothetical protein